MKGPRPRHLLGSFALAVLSAAVLGAQTLAGVIRPPRIAGLSKAATTTHAPDEFGTQDYTVTIISASSFTPSSDDSAFSPNYYGGLTRGFLADPNTCLAPGQLGDLWATVNIPSGAVIDYIGIETHAPSDGLWGVALWLMDRSGNQTAVETFSSSAHGWETDYNLAPFGYQLSRNVHNELVLQVEEAGTAAGCPSFAWAEIWWKRVVSPAPATASFNDVPTSDPAFQFIEALKASGITAGCGGGNYCPDAPLTRRQMAVFLSKGFGLHWPY